MGLLIFLLLLAQLSLEGPAQAGGEISLAIEIQRGEETAEALTVPVREGMTLLLAYTHSLYHTPQKELYAVSRGGLVLREIHFGNMEAALYYNAHPPEGYLQEKGLWILRLSRPSTVPAVQMRIPVTVPLQLILDGTVIWTPRREDRGGLLTLRIPAGH